MIIWSIFWGAVLGAFLSDYGLWLGAMLGFFAGFTLRWAVRHEIDARQKAWRLDAASAARSGASPASAASRTAGSAPDNEVQRPGWLDTVPSPDPALAAAAPVPQRRSDGPLLAANGLSAGATSASDAAPASGQAVPAQARAAAGPSWAGDPSAPAQPRPNPRPPIPPDEPNALDQTFAAARDWLLGGNTIVRVGLVILFIGLSFLVRYAALAGLFPVELRLGVVGVAALALLAIGFGKRQARPDFALALQGGGVAVLYLTVFAAFRLYALLPVPLAFGMMIVVCALSCALALLQNSSALAVAAFAGGFAVPLLLSTGQGSHVALFSYYAVLNLAILFIAWKRAWRVLNAVGFIATFGVATAWGVLAYRPEHYASAQFFLMLFVLIYLLAAVLYARSTPTRLGGAVDAMLVFGTPLIGFGLQAGLVQPLELGTAFSALGFGALYLMSAFLVRRTPGRDTVLGECLTAIGVGFATLAVPLALDARWTSAVWALEGAGAFWAGMRQARWMPRAFGLLMQLVAALAFLPTLEAPGANVAAWPFANPVFIGALFIALPAVLIAWWLREPLAHSGSRWAQGYAGFETQLASPVYLYGFAFWCLAWALETARRLPASELDQLAAPVFSQGAAQLLTLLAVVASAALSQTLGRRQDWAVAVWPSRLTLPAMAFMLLVQLTSGHRVLDMPGWVIWPLVLALHYGMLRRNDAMAAQASPASSWLLENLHIGGVWLLTVLLADCLWFGIDHARLWNTAWAGVVLLVSATAVLMLLAGWAGRANQAARLALFGWPLNPHAAAYYGAAAQPLALLVFLGALGVALFSSGRTEPLPYVPLLNPTDLTLALALGALVFWRKVLLTASPPPAGTALACGRETLVALAALAFIAVNTVWLRIAHHFFHIDWDGGALFGSFVVQTGYAILWTLLALALMLLAHRRGQRALWLTGAGLLGLVVAKLLLIDLSNAGGAERIIAFIAVGVLMLLVGYLAPLPPRVAAPAESEPDAGGSSGRSGSGDDTAGGTAQARYS